MGLFGKRREAPPAAPPPRRGKVMELLSASMAAADLDIDAPGFDAALRRYEEARKGATPAEIDAAHEAARRHGYP